MKLIITSVDALKDSTTNDYFPGLLEVLEYFLSLETGNEILVLSKDSTKLKGLSKEFNTKVSEDRMTAKVIDDIIREKPQFSHSDIIVLGANNADMILAANSKVLLLSAKYARSNNLRSRVFKYGIGITSVKSLKYFFEHFLKITRPWYFRLQVSDKTTLYALTNANTYTPDQDLIKMNDAFRNCLKNGDPTYNNEFAAYFLMSTFSWQLINDLREVNYWGIYPTSGTEMNDVLNNFKEHVRKAFNGKSDEPIFIKTGKTPKRQNRNATLRISEGCDHQLKHIILNPYYTDRIPGKTVCIIDDFTTYGTSCETARILLEKAGAKRVIFIALGKFGNYYYKYEYKVEGDVFGKFEATQKKCVSLTGGDINPNSNKSLIDSLSHMFNK